MTYTNSGVGCKQNRCINLVVSALLTFMHVDSVRYGVAGALPLHSLTELRTGRVGRQKVKRKTLCGRFALECT